MVTLFWVSAFVVLYVYVGYPLLLALWARLAGRRRAQSPGSRSTWTPPVTVVIAARNEGRRLAARLENLFASDYPRDRMQVIVASDGSTDDTCRVVEAFGSRVECLDLAASGKAAALNAAVARAAHPVIVFADARQRFAADAIRRLVNRLADPDIGAVSGELVIKSDESTIGDGIGAYWRYEKWLRRCEAVVGSTIGVTGAIYAMRRELWTPLPADAILDDVMTPMRVVLEGHRVVFEERARAYDVASPDPETEMRRKVRTLAGNFQLLARQPRLLVPGLNPVWIQFMSHKVGRLVVPYALVALFVSSAFLARQALVYGVALIGQAVFYALAAYGAQVAAADQPGRMTKLAEVRREAA